MENSWQQRLAADQIVLIDGATGTELQRRGVPMDEIAWSGRAYVCSADATVQAPSTSRRCRRRCRNWKLLEACSRRRPSIPLRENQRPSFFDVAAGQVLCDVHGLTAPIGIEIDGADFHSDLESGGIELFAPLSDAQEGSGHCHDHSGGLLRISFFDVRNVREEIFFFRCALLFALGNFVEQAIAATLAHASLLLIHLSASSTTNGALARVASQEENTCAR